MMLWVSERTSSKCKLMSLSYVFFLNKNSMIHFSGLRFLSSNTWCMLGFIQYKDDSRSHKSWRKGKERERKQGREYGCDAYTTLTKLLCLRNPLKKRKTGVLFLIDFKKKRGQYFSAPPILSKQPKDLNQAEDKKKQIMQPSLRCRVGSNLTENEYKQKLQLETEIIGFSSYFHALPKKEGHSNCTWQAAGLGPRGCCGSIWLCGSFFAQTTCVSQLTG